MYATSPPMCKNRRKNEPVRFAYIRLLTDNSCMRIVPHVKTSEKTNRFASPVSRFTPARYYHTIFPPSIYSFTSRIQSKTMQDNIEIPLA